MSHVLLIESDRILARNLAQALEQAGLSVTITADAQAAITCADAETPSLVIVDLLLAGRSGIEFLYELRSYPEWQDVPVFVLTNVPKDEVSARRRQDLGIIKYIYKPELSLEALVAGVRESVHAKA